MNKDNIDKGIGKDACNAVECKNVSDKMTGYNVKRTVRKFANQEMADKNIPYEIVTAEQNILLNAGINELTTLMCSTGGTKFDNANAQSGVGDSTVAAVATQTDLQATTNKAYVGMEVGFPTFGTNQKMTFRSSFGGAVANFPWQEFVIRNGATALKCLNRKVQSLGVKSSPAVWELTTEITWS